VKRLVLFNIGIFQDEKRYLLEEIKVPVAWFMGGGRIWDIRMWVRCFVFDGILRSLLTVVGDRLKRITSYSLLGCRRTRQTSTQAMAARLRRQTEAKRLRRQWLTSSGSSGTTKRPRRSCWSRRLREVLCQTSGRWSIRTGADRGPRSRGA